MADRVVFLRPDAERIARVVRAVENGNRDEKPLTFRRVGGEGGGGKKVFRVCTFSGEWGFGATKTVTFKYQSATPNTVSAVNLFFPVTSIGIKDCAVAKDGTAWFLVAVPLVTAAAVQSVSVFGALDQNCSVAITVTTTTTQVLQFQ